MQKLYGAALGRRALFFSLQSYTDEARSWADEVGMALFRFDLQGEPTAVNSAARTMLAPTRSVKGDDLMDRAASVAVGPDETLGALLSQAEEHGSLSSRLLVHLAPGDVGVADGRALAEMVAATIDKPLRVITADQLRSDSRIELRLLQRLVAGQVIYLEQVELFRTGPLKLLLAAFCNQLALRPSDETVADVVGEEVLARVRTVIEGARERKSRVPHLLFSGPPGTCKTTLAVIVANMMGGSLVVTSGPVLSRVPNLAGLLTAAEGRTVVFIDEIHRMPPAAEEVLYEVLKDGTLSIIVGSGNNARAVRLKLPSMLFIGATTEPGALSQPLRDRFGAQFRMEPRSPNELTSLVRRVWDRAELAYEDGAACLVAERSKGMPWRARHLALRLAGARTEAAKRGTVFTADFVSAVFDRFAFNDDGFTETDWLVQDVGWGDTTLLSGPHGSLPAVSMIASTSIPWERGSDARDGLGPLGKAIPHTLVMPRLHSRNAMMLRWEVRDIPLMR